MGSSFIEYRNFGFWSYDPFIERLANDVSDSIGRQVKIADWENELIEYWNLQTIGGFEGRIDLKLDEFILEERRNRFIKIIQEVTDKYPANDPIHLTGQFLQRLLDGQLRTVAASPL